MNAKKSLIAVAAMALALMGFASSASAATDGVIQDVSSVTFIPNNTTVHFVGAAAFLDANGNGIECHVTSIAQATGATGLGGDITNFSVPKPTSLCTGKGLFAGCTVTSVTAKNLPYAFTTTPTDFDVTGNITIEGVLHGFLCPSPIKLTFTAVTAKPLNTTSKAPATGTAGNLGTTAAQSQEISGVELSGTGIGDIPGLGEVAINASGKLEISEAAKRCTWMITVF